MTAHQPSERRPSVKPRRALVLGGGGVVGTMWMAGLAAGLRQCEIALADADLLVGTSAGAIVAAVLAGGQDPRGLVAPRRPAAAVRVDQGALGAVIAVLSRPDPDRAAAARRVAAIAEAAHTRTQREHVERMTAVVGDSAWPGRRLWITAVDAASGELVVFDGSAGQSLARAVAASTAFPGIYPPVTLGGGTYIDGGVRSATNADLVRGPELLVVVAPLLHLRGRRELEREIEAAEATAAVVVAPDADSIAHFGADLQATSRSKEVYDAGFRQARAAAAELGDAWQRTGATPDQLAPGAPAVRVCRT